MDLMKQDGRSVRASEKKKIKKEIILKAAQKVICQKGYQSTTISDIIDEADISRGTYYIYFQSLEGVFHELVDDLIAKILKCIKPISIDDGRPMEDLHSNVDRIVTVLFENRDLTSILLKEAIAADKKVDQKLNTLYSFLYRLVRGAIKNGVKSGLLRNVDENIIAMAFIGSIKETLYQCLVVEDQHMNPRKITDELLKFCLLGLKK